jgi:Antitoxin Phd_YefM, type II toxin-antitoxin system
LFLCARITRVEALYGRGMATATQTAIRTPVEGSPPPAAIVRTSNIKSVRTIRSEVEMAISASKLRANVYRLLDEVLETGQPLEIERNGKTLVVAPKEEQSIWERLPRREGYIVGDPDELIHIDWSSEWNPDPS